MTMTALDVNTNPTPSRAPGALTIRTDVDVDREEEEEEEDWSPDSLFDEPMEAETERTSPRTPPSVHILAQATPSTQAPPPAPTQAAPPPPPPAPRAIPPIPSAPGAHERVARRTCPPIPGLYFDPGARLARARAERVRAGCMRAFFGGEADRADRANQANQVRAGGAGEGEVGEGEGEGERWDVYVPEGGIVALTGEARYRWTHGIEGRAGDWVEAEDGEDGEGEGGARPVWVPRKARVSVTFRWMLPGADVVGA
ncbi:hypothetical protein OF83DRAFT_1087458 [Amylostereum chailletii]|nr:hypothetical protein OF83DRAFT_1087458 [Amylostereum chailletii]